ncbi:MAG: hypothetical protein NTU43_00610 [Bacteroidetes bacterium]|nr:hypothetical protein [Bacteroidota bacterium]
MKTLNKIIPFLLCVVFFASCEKDYLSTADTSAPIDTSKPISFNESIQPLFTSNCLGSGCHITGGITPNLEVGKAYDQLTGLGYVDATDTLPGNSKLYSRVIGTTKPMPPIGKLSAGKIKAIELWIQQGSQNN